MSDLRPQATPPLIRRDPAVWIYGAALLILAGGLGWLLFNPTPQPSRGPMEALEQRLARLEQRPAAPTPDFSPLEARLGNLERRPTPTAPPPANLAPLEARLAALEQRRPPDMAPLESRIGALEQRPTADIGPLTTRLDALAGRQDALSARAQANETALAARSEAVEARVTSVEEQAAGRVRALETKLETMERRLAAAEAAAGQVPALAARAARLARLQAAQTALEEGKPLGEISTDAPASLTRFATAAPPTESALRLAFPAAARAAQETAAPPPSDAPLIERVWLRAQSLVTVRQGDRVLLGDPVVGVVARARRALEAGDLAGAVAILGELQGAARAAMANWTAQAQGLLDARAALAALAVRA